MEAGESEVTTNNVATGKTASVQIERKKQFICGVIEGFYGRPWTTEQRKDLFRKLKKWGMDSYVYAPKDDYKHRAYWRELYTVEEADHLTSLIAAAKEHNVTFYYALSPGLDMTYSSQKELQTLKRKLDQVSQFGCEAFALLFDDIEPELSKVDKEVFQTFSNAQVSVTNDIYTHLGTPKFLFCPTQYCSSRAVPTVQDSEYLNTLGSKLNHDIDIMWTGNKVISKTITLESIQQVSEVLRRPPVIWDNLHANDYDQKRVFLGPYTGRSPELIAHLHGVMTNPNCEFHANTIAIHTLAYWSHCNLDSKLNSAISADIKLETENEDGTSSEDMALTDCCVSKNVYYPRVALKNALTDWLPEFFVEKEAWGPITKPQPQVTMVIPIIPIIPSINTCMSLTTTTNTSTTSKSVKTVPEVNTTQLQALADVCSTVSSSVLNPTPNPIMNSLVSPTKVITNDDIINPITTNAAANIDLPKKIPISIVSVPIMVKSTITDGEVSDDNSNSDLPDVTNCHRSLSDTEEVSLKQSDNFKNIETDITEQNVTKDVLPNNEVAPHAKSPEKQDIVVNNLDETLPEIEEKAEATSAEKTDKILIASQGLNIDTNTMPMEEQNEISSPLSGSGQEPMEYSSSINSQQSPKDICKAITTDDVVMSEATAAPELNNSMQIESSEASPLSNAEMREDEEIKSMNSEADQQVAKMELPAACKITIDDLLLLCDLFYLPFEHGSRGFKLLNEFNWLKANANVLLNSDKNVVVSNNKSHGKEQHKSKGTAKPEVAEWLQRAETFSTLCNLVQQLVKKVALCANKEICHDLFSYVWDIAGTLTLLNAFVKWLSLGDFPSNIYTYTQGSYTWFSRGWKEAFMSGDQEPWVFRGGLIADLQRLMPVDSGNDLFLYKQPELPISEIMFMRPYVCADEADVNDLCFSAFLERTVNTASKEQLRKTWSELISDSILGPFITFYPNFCIVAHQNNNKTNSHSIVGYVAAALDIKIFTRKVDVCWLPTMREKYPQSILQNLPDILQAQLRDMINEFHCTEPYECPIDVSNAFPAILTVGVLKDSVAVDDGLLKRLVTVSLATLRSNGCFGVHVRVSLDDTEQLQCYGKLGFVEAYRDANTRYIYMGRRF